MSHMNEIFFSFCSRTHICVFYCLIFSGNLLKKEIYCYVNDHFSVVCLLLLLFFLGGGGGKNLSCEVEGRMIDGLPL